MPRLESRLDALEAGTAKPVHVLAVFGDDSVLSPAQEATKARAEAAGREVMVIHFVALRRSDECNNEGAPTCH